MLIGVDHGNKQIKTVHCNPFVSGLKQSVTRPFGQNVLRYQNTSEAECHPSLWTECAEVSEYLLYAVY